VPNSVGPVGVRGLGKESISIADDIEDFSFRGSGYMKLWVGEKLISCRVHLDAVLRGNLIDEPVHFILGLRPFRMWTIDSTADADLKLVEAARSGDDQHPRSLLARSSRIMDCPGFNVDKVTLMKQDLLVTSRELDGSLEDIKAFVEAMTMWGCPLALFHSADRKAVFAIRLLGCRQISKRVAKPLNPNALLGSEYGCFTHQNDLPCVG
jgi:hypothetical protein